MCVGRCFSLEFAELLAARHRTRGFCALVVESDGALFGDEDAASFYPTDEARA